MTQKKIRSFWWTRFEEPGHWNDSNFPSLVIIRFHCWYYRKVNKWGFWPISMKNSGGHWFSRRWCTASSRLSGVIINATRSVMVFLMGEQTSIYYCAPGKCHAPEHCPWLYRNIAFNVPDLLWINVDCACNEAILHINAFCYSKDRHTVYHTGLLSHCGKCSAVPESHQGYLI